MKILGKKQTIMSSQNTTFDSVALPIRHAALGYISGTLEEWPTLDNELRKHGVICLQPHARKPAAKPAFAL